MKKTNYLVMLLTIFFSGLIQAQTAQAGPEVAVDDEELPVVGVRYYFYPNLDAYYDSQTNLYIFQQNGQWIKGKEIASGYRGYSLLNNVRVAITDYNGDQPYTKLDEHRQKFPKQYSAKRHPPKKEVAYN